MASLIPNFNIEPTFFSDLSKNCFDPQRIFFSIDLDHDQLISLFFCVLFKAKKPANCDKRKRQVRI